MEQIFPHLGYGLMLLALAVRDILWLRSILVFAQLSLAAYAIMANNMAVAFWNVLFVCINSIQVVRILKERRPVELPADAADLYTEMFSVMSRREFLFFWQRGTINEVCDTWITREGERQNELSLILSGTVQVVKNGSAIARLSRGSFIAEMSFLTGEPASADVIAQGRVHCISWQQETLRSLEQANPQLLIKIQGVLGRDLVDKIRTASGTLHEKNLP